MRKLVVVGALLLAACSSPTEDQGQAQPLPTVATVTTRAPRAATTTTKPAMTCAKAKAAGWTLYRATNWWYEHDTPKHMDPDDNGLPCEKEYGSPVGPNEPTPGSGGQSCAEIGHPYAAKPGDPHDGDGDGIACER
jgi:hypothetical protein